MQHAKANAKITIDVLDRVVNGTITEEEFARYMPFWQELFSDRTPTYEANAQSVQQALSLMGSRTL